MTTSVSATSWDKTEWELEVYEARRGLLELTDTLEAALTMRRPNGEVVTLAIQIDDNDDIYVETWFNVGERAIEDPVNTLAITDSARARIASIVEEIEQEKCWAKEIEEEALQNPWEVLGSAMGLLSEEADDE